MARYKAKIVLVSLISSLLMGCSGQAILQNSDTLVIHDKNKVVESFENTKNKDDEEDIVGINNDDLDKDKVSEDDIDLSLNPNEAGAVMVLMYHGISSEESTWVRTPDNFRKDLQTLYDKGYRPISLVDFVNNNIEIEAGYTPVVITFDDGNLNNFNIIGENESGLPIIDPESAVGILEEFNKDHPDFPLEATFFLNGSNPFRQPEYIEYKLNYIVEKGMDIGNHTLGHNNLSNSNNKDDIQKYIGSQSQFLENIIMDYEINTFALPFGARPKDKELYKYLHEGNFDEFDYNNRAVLNVGWMPSVSSIDKKFNPLSIHRVRASEMNVDGVGMYDWINNFDKYPERRFISDGFSQIVTVPKKYENKVDLNKIGEKKLYIYEK